MGLKEDIENQIESTEFPGKEGKILKCDYCNSILERDSEITAYITDVNLLDRDRRGLFLSRTYCSTCDRKKVQYPHSKSFEGIVKAKLNYVDGSPRLSNVELIHISTRGSGKDWDADLLMDLTGMSRLFESDEHISYSTLTHEDLVDILRWSTIDIERIFDDDGNVTLSRRELDELKRTYLSEITRQFE